MDMQLHHACGGAILRGTCDGVDYVYCDKCHAFNYHSMTRIPAGTNEVKNKEAWDSGAGASPEVTKPSIAPIVVKRVSARGSKLASIPRTSRTAAK